MTLYQHTFTGTNGASWDTAAWNLVANGTSSLGSATIQSNKGALTSGTVAYGRAMEAAYKTQSSLVDSEVYVEFSTSTIAEEYLTVALRAPFTMANPSGSFPLGGYGVEVHAADGTYLFMRFSSGGSGTQIGSGSFAIVAGTTYSVRLRAEGSRIRLRMWATSGTEPTTWTQDVTDGTPWLTGGTTYLSTQNGGDGAARTFTIDNLTVDDLAVTGTSVTPTFPGTNGAAWPSPWLIGTDFPSTQVYQTGAGKGHFGTATGGYAASPVIYWNANFAKNSVVTLDVAWDAFIESYVILALRSDSSVVGDWWSHSGYNLVFQQDNGALTLSRANGTGQGTTLVTGTYAFTSGATTRVEFSAINGQIDVRLWSSGGSRPSTPSLTYADATPDVTVGSLYMKYIAGAGSGPQGASVNNITINNTSGAATGSLTLGGTGALTATGRPGTVGTDAGTGSGTLTNAGKVNVAGTTARSGSGTAAFAGATSVAQAVALSGTGTLALASIPMVALTLSGSGALSTPTTAPGLAASLTLSGSGVMTRTGPQVSSGAIALLGTGSQTRSAPQYSFGAMALSGRGVITGDGVYSPTMKVFRTPFVKTYYPQLGQLLGRLPHRQGVTVLKSSGFYRSIPEPSAEDIEAADIAYLGGRDYLVTLPEAAELRAAGYRISDRPGEYGIRGKVAALKTPTRGWYSGNSGQGSDFNATEFGDWRGNPIDFKSYWIDVPDGGGWGWDSSIFNNSGPAAGFTGLLDVAIGGPSNYATAAAGALDDWFREAMMNLRIARTINGVLYPTIIRPAHEMNGNWFAWTVPNDGAENFRTVMRNWRLILDEEYPEAIWAFCPNSTTMTGPPVAELYEDGVWDLIGVDRYNQFPYVGTSYSGVHTSWEEFALQGDSNNPYGLEAWRIFAEERDLPLYLPEYASNAHAPDNLNDSGDDPYYITTYLNWVQANCGSGPGQILAESYFNIADGVSDAWPVFRTDGGVIHGPQTAAAYRAFFRMLPS